MKKFLVVCSILFSALGLASAQPSPGLPAGTQAPDFSAVTYEGKDIRLSDFYNRGSVVLIFYRGGWCYYCNLQLQDYQKHFDEFQQLGASVIAVSVDKQEKAAQMVGEKGFGFEVVSDPQADLLELYNVVYQVPEDLAEKYKKEYHIDLEAYSGRNDRIIAVPATYVIDRNGKIIFAHSDTDYKIRKNPEDILNVIRAM